ncbi:zinc finger protein, putative [Plasmodium berghei ANKA]|uniref:Zinc finger protein, putative n=1 Tax=Plasmodium berghei (strain Anka) TaxID=5823 RepID=A0A509AQU0_PLABA|nr:zinc finger protein, putative [Plasmodium berghei ANKA]VUC57273.1 zinc finger protein, putative [Plasmodium berghei ANKA]|eukprot:XP_034423051.1 zinc finger protein, putative [Plasmodium berghei ANKA]
MHNKNKYKMECVLYDNRNSRDTLCNGELLNDNIESYSSHEPNNNNNNCNESNNSNNGKCKTIYKEVASNEPSENSEVKINSKLHENNKLSLGINCINDNVVDNFKTIQDYSANNGKNNKNMHSKKLPKNKAEYNYFYEEGINNKGSNLNDSLSKKYSNSNVMPENIEKLSKSIFNNNDTSFIVTTEKRSFSNYENKRKKRFNNHEKKSHTFIGKQKDNHNYNDITQIYSYKNDNAKTPEYFCISNNIDIRNNCKNGNINAKNSSIPYNYDLDNNNEKDMNNDGIIDRNDNEKIKKNDNNIDNKRSRFMGKSKSLNRNNIYDDKEGIKSFEMSTLDDDAEKNDYTNASIKMDFSNNSKLKEKKVDTYGSMPNREANYDFKSALNFQFCKTKMCPYMNTKEKCKRFSNNMCPYAHDQNELKPIPNLYKTAMCRNFMKNMCFKSKKECKFAHHVEELRSTDEFYKTTLCKFFLNGYCKADKNCRHAHGQNELKCRSTNNVLLENTKTNIKHSNTNNYSSGSNNTNSNNTNDPDYDIKRCKYSNNKNSVNVLKSSDDYFSQNDNKGNTLANEEDNALELCNNETNNENMKKKHFYNTSRKFMSISTKDTYCFTSNGLSKNYLSFENDDDESIKTNYDSNFDKNAEKNKFKNNGNSSSFLKYEEYNSECSFKTPENNNCDGVSNKEIRGTINKSVKENIEVNNNERNANKLEYQYEMKNCNNIVNIAKGEMENNIDKEAKKNEFDELNKVKSNNKSVSYLALEKTNNNNNNIILNENLLCPKENDNMCNLHNGHIGENTLGHDAQKSSNEYSIHGKNEKNKHSRKLLNRYENNNKDILTNSYGNENIKFNDNTHMDAQKNSNNNGAYIKSRSSTISNENNNNNYCGIPGDKILGKNCEYEDSYGNKNMNTHNYEINKKNTHEYKKSCNKIKRNFNNSGNYSNCYENNFNNNMENTTNDCYSNTYINKSHSKNTNNDHIIYPNQRYINNNKIGNRNSSNVNSKCSNNYCYNNDDISTFVGNAIENIIPANNYEHSKAENGRITNNIGRNNNYYDSYNSHDGNTNRYMHNNKLNYINGKQNNHYDLYRGNTTNGNYINNNNYNSYEHPLSISNNMIKSSKNYKGKKNIYINNDNNTHHEMFNSNFNNNKYYNNTYDGYNNNGYNDYQNKKNKKNDNNRNNNDKKNNKTQNNNINNMYLENSAKSRVNNYSNNEFTSNGNTHNIDSCNISNGEFLIEKYNNDECNNEYINDHINVKSNGDKLLENNVSTYDYDDRQINIGNLHKREKGNSYNNRINPIMKNSMGNNSYKNGDNQYFSNIINGNNRTNSKINKHIMHMSNNDSESSKSHSDAHYKNSRENDISTIINNTDISSYNTNINNKKVIENDNVLYKKPKSHSNNLKIGINENGEELLFTNELKKKKKKKGNKNEIYSNTSDVFYNKEKENMKNDSKVELNENEEQSDSSSANYKKKSKIYSGNSINSVNLYDKYNVARSKNVKNRNKSTFISTHDSVHNINDNNNNETLNVMTYLVTPLKDSNTEKGKQDTRNYLYSNTEKNTEDDILEKPVTDNNINLQYNKYDRCLTNGELKTCVSCCQYIKNVDNSDFILIDESCLKCGQLIKKSLCQTIIELLKPQVQYIFSDANFYVQNYQD